MEVGKDIILKIKIFTYLSTGFFSQMVTRNTFILLLGLTRYDILTYLLVTFEAT